MEVREAYSIATRINGNATTAIKGSALGKIVIGNAGTTWTIQVQDNASTPNIKVIITPVAGATYHFGWAFGGQGCTIVTAGTTPGDICVTSG